MIWILLMAVCYFGITYGNVSIKSQKKYIAIFILTFLCIISGTRYNMGGSDYFIYQVIFNASPILKDFSLMSIQSNWITKNYEIGYIFLNSVIKSIGFSFYGFTLIHSIIFYLCMYYGLKRYIKDYYIFILFFLYKLFLYDTFISMRQSITIAIFFCALHLIEEKKAVKYFILCIIAIIIHNGAWILFPIYFINKVSLTKRKVLWLNIVFIPMLIFSYINNPIWNLISLILEKVPFAAQGVRVNTFIDSAGGSTIDIFHTLEYLLFMILVYVFFDKLMKIDEHAEFIVKLFLILLPLFTLLRNNEVLTRLKDYFTLTYPMILGYLCLIDNKKFRIIIQIATVMLCTFGFFRFVILFNNSEMMNYQSYLFKEISIFQ